MLNDRSMAAARPSDLKVNNRIKALELFKSGMVLSVADIAREIGVSRQTVMKAVQYYLEKGFIVSEGKACSGSMGGKRAELFSLPADRCLFSILICPSEMKITLFNFRGETIDACDRPGGRGFTIDEIADRAYRACDEMLKANGIGRERLFGVCLATPGIVDHRNNRIRYNALFPEWGRDIPIVDKLTARFGEDVLVVMENVGKLCGIGFVQDSLTENACIATVFSGWGGVCACQMVKGMVLNGADSLIGEIGHMILEPEDDEVCGCGSRGCFERQVSVDRMRRLIAEMAGDYPDSPLVKCAPEEITIRGIFEASVSGDTLGRRLSAYAAEYFARALRNLMLMFNPKRVIFQGDYACADDCFRETMFDALKTFQYFNSEGRPFELLMDRRPISELITTGAYTLLIDRLFSDERACM